MRMGDKKNPLYRVVVVDSRKAATGEYIACVGHYRPTYEPAELDINVELAKEWLAKGGLGEVTDLRPEVFQGDSRFDFSFQKDGKICFLEVKGVTLENDGICAFPDAPTPRGAKHLRELTALAGKGYGAYVLFVIQMADVKYLHPNDQTDPAFGKALREAQKAGVQVMAMDCAVTEDSMNIRLPVLVKL